MARCKTDMLSGLIRKSPLAPLFPPGQRPYGPAAKEGDSVRRQSPNARLEVSNAALDGGASLWSPTQSGLSPSWRAPRAGS